ncbi:PREDICTED: SUN domain-containing protein 1 isoform X3 [Chinchilla lanigera]|uniref:SUN domain-containing protein 1 isoform X3 n=1 Tax=Chinchilla lanigera TaxID=34839 RepID=UPI00038EB011|nr:PREDICTED: SUN domain-containing protein 1 isoform X3 [Chinchilla lanigera]
MDFSRLHTYTPPQCVPENTGYTYALRPRRLCPGTRSVSVRSSGVSEQNDWPAQVKLLPVPAVEHKNSYSCSSYSSDALDFETEHRLDPVFDSPRMSRRSLRLVTAAYSSGDSQAMDAHSCASSTASLQDRAARTVKQRRSVSKQASLSINHLSGKVTSSSISQGNLQGSVPLRPPVLDETLIREQTKVDHFWGLDDDGDLKGGNKAATQGNGDLAADTAARNGYTCRDCSMLSERTDVLTAHPATHGTASRIYSRDRNLKRGVSFYMDRTWWLAKHTSSSFSSFLVQLFQVVLMKLNYESDNYKLKNYESKDCESESYKSKSHESKAHRSYCGRMTVTELPREDDRPSVHTESLCYFLMQMLGRARAAGWFVSKTVWSVLWLAIVAPGKVASGALWWLGIGWYQFVTLISWLNVFLLTRCLRNTCKFLILLVPLLLLLGAGLSLWGQSDFFSLLPVLNWTDVRTVERVEDSKDTFRPGSSHLQDNGEASRWLQENDMRWQVASFSAQCHNHEEKLGELTVLLQKLQVRVDQIDDGREGLSLWMKDMVGQHLQEMNAAGLLSTKTDFMTFHHEHEVRLSKLEDVLRKLTEKSEAIHQELEQTKPRTISGAEEQPLLPRVERLEQELRLLQSQLSDWQQLKAGCEQVDAQVKESLRVMFSEDQQGGSLEWLVQKLSSRYVSRDDLQALLRDLELQVLKNITHHLVVTGQKPTSETVVSAVSGAGISGITEAQARVIVNNALKLYSQDKTGMVDFALESGGGSILSTRCSETYETKTALLSLFGIPLWYFSQSPRVVIQPDIYPGNCWAFKGSQGYLVVRLSMKIHPTMFTVEHIPKTLSPMGNISSAPKDFAVYGLENEYQEEGQPLGQFTYDQEGESLQMFQALEIPDRAFQIVELRILSNWGHPEYTCLYRFRVHGQPAQ